MTYYLKYINIGDYRWMWLKNNGRRVVFKDKTQGLSPIGCCKSVIAYQYVPLTKIQESNLTRKEKDALNRSHA